MSEREIDEETGTTTTGHEWDGIKELNTPLPRWWLWTFYGCIAFALIYTIFYPAWPLITSATGGVLGYSIRADLAAEIAASEAGKGEVLARLAAVPIDEILADDELARFARSAGRSAFKVNCIQCHGTGAEGSAGYPNLNDDEWIWGGTIDQIYLTIAHGSRSSTDPDTHFALMPNFGTEQLLTGEEIAAVSGHAASLSGLDGGVSTPEGSTLFADNCVACHGALGEGNPDVGGPSLRDPIWLYGGTVTEIESQVRHPRHGVMPAWAGRLPDTTLKQLAVYIHTLGGGL